MEEQYFEKTTLHYLYENKYVNSMIKININYIDMNENIKNIEKVFEYNEQDYLDIPNTTANIIKKQNIKDYLIRFNIDSIDLNESNTIKFQLMINENNNKMTILADKIFCLNDFIHITRSFA